MSKENISIRLEPDTLSQVERIAALTQRDRTAVISDALDAYLGFHQWQLAELERALAEADRGDFATAEETEAVDNKYRA